jgi:hypothetical protein
MIKLGQRFTVQNKVSVKMSSRDNVFLSIQYALISDGEITNKKCFYSYSTTFH